MLSTKQLEEILATALKTGGEFAEIFIERSSVSGIVCEDNKIEKIASGTDFGAGIRIINGRETSFACTSEVDFISLKKTAEKASKAVKGSLRSKKISLKPVVSAMPYPVKRRPNTVSIDEKTAVIENADRTARSLSGLVKQVTVRYADSNQGVTIANSEGLYIEDNRIRTRFFINVIAEKNGVLQTGYEGPGGSCGFELFERYPAEEMAKEAGERAVKMLDAPHAPAGTMPVVMSSKAGGTMIHEACGHALEGDFIMKGTSIFGNNIGKKVASELITVIDDATIPGQFGTFRFDDEGIPSQKTVLIERGMLKGFMTDRIAAKALGLPPSGNGRRESFRNKPSPRMTNTYIKPGNSDPEEIIASIKNGLWVKKMGGGEVNVTSGDFVFEVSEAYLIEDGKIRHPVRGAMLIGNGPEVLNLIDMVGTDLHFIPGVCGKYDHAPVSDAQPTIRIPKILVGGR